MVWIRFPRIVFSILCVLCASLPAHAQQPPAEVRMGMNAPNAAHWSLFIAEDQGFFRDQGLHVTRVMADGPAGTISLLASKSVDIIAGGTDDVIASIAHGIPIRIVAPAFYTNPFALLTAPGITSWNDLKGKTVVIGPKLNEGGFSFDVMARANGLSPSDFNLIVVTNSNLRYAALTSGKVSGAILVQPFDVLAKAQGMHVLADAERYFKPWMYSAFCAEPSWMAANRGTVVAFIRALRKANAFGYAHPDAAIASLVKNLRIDPKVARAVYDLDFHQWHAFDPTERIAPEVLQAVSSRALQVGSITEMPALSAMYDPSYAEAASR
jgi:NitT/TauT family transport system substrate-binding protein